jgi:hypothetical protein
MNFSITQKKVELLIASVGSVQKAVTRKGETGGVFCRVVVEQDARPGRRPPWR